MAATVLRVDPHHPEPEYIRIAALLLKQGGLVAFPTETVYGLGALALDEEKALRIFTAKGRPGTNPLIVHVLDVAMARQVCAEWPGAAEILAQALWPGPLTMILPKSKQVPAAVTAGRDSVAVRSPSHPVARALLAAVQAPIAAPSANLYTEISATRAEHIHKGLSARIDLILDSGPCEIGVESTVLDLTSPVPTLLRPGAISQARIAEILQTHVAVLSQYAEADVPQIAPGQQRRHYSPKSAKTALIQAGDVGEMNDRIVRVLRLSGRVGVMSRTIPLAARPGLIVHTMPETPEAYAAALYTALHALEDAGCAYILIEQVPSNSEWAAVQDRLSRAAEIDV